MSTLRKAVDYVLTKAATPGNSYKSAVASKPARVTYNQVNTSVEAAPTSRESTTNSIYTFKPSAHLREFGWTKLNWGALLSSLQNRDAYRNVGTVLSSFYEQVWYDYRTESKRIIRANFAREQDGNAKISFEYGGNGTELLSGGDVSVTELTNTKVRNNPAGVPASTTKTMTNTVATVLPAVAGRPAVPYTPPTPPEFAAVVNAGWGTSARSIEPVTEESFISFTVNSGVYGAFLGLGRKSMDDFPNSRFQHGLLLDTEGVWVFESGTKVEQLTDYYSSNATLRIIRQPDNEVVYMLINGGESILHRSSVKARAGKLFGYGRLYSGDDVIDNAAITSGKLQYGRA